MLEDGDVERPLILVPGLCGITFGTTLSLSSLKQEEPEPLQV